MKAVYFLYLNRHGYRGLCRITRAGISTFPTVIIKIRISLKRNSRICRESPAGNVYLRQLDETLAMLKAGDVVYCDPLYTVRFPAITLMASLKMTSITCIRS